MGGRQKGGERRGGKDTWIERNESGEEHRRVFHLQAGLSRSFIIPLEKVRACSADTFTCREGRRVAFKDGRSAAPHPPLLGLLRRAAVWKLSEEVINS